MGTQWRKKKKKDRKTDWVPKWELWWWCWSVYWRLAAARREVQNSESIGLKDQRLSSLFFLLINFYVDFNYLQKRASLSDLVSLGCLSSENLTFCFDICSSWSQEASDTAREMSFFFSKVDEYLLVDLTFSSSCVLMWGSFRNDERERDGGLCGEDRSWRKVGARKHRVVVHIHLFRSSGLQAMLFFVNRDF